MKFPIFRSLVIPLAAVFLASSYSLAELPAHNVPQALSIAKDLGRVNASSALNLTVVLTPHNEAQYHQAIQSLYDPNSATYHHWFTDADFAKYAPTQEEFDTVKRELVNQGFTVVSSDPNRFSLRVSGTVGNAESAFHTEIHSFQLKNGRTFQAHTTDASLGGAAGALVKAVSGLERHQSVPKLVFQKDPKTQQQRGKVLLSKVEDSGGVLSTITGTPLTASETVSINDGAGTTGTYSGTVYDQNSSLVVTYTPQQLQTHYGLTNLIKQGYNGKGQTIALVEAYGYDSIESDANQAAQLFGLPAVNSSNFELIYPEGKPLYPDYGVDTGWDTETAIDVQTAHAIAPGAKIVVLAAAGQDNEDQINSLEYIIDNHIANTVSNSWENDDEIISGIAESEAFNAVLEKGAAYGISFQFSSGDSGDLGLGTPVGAVGVPSNSPYAVAVGGTSILNNPYGSGDIVTGWGTGETFLGDSETYDGSTYAYVADPPTGEAGFAGGAGGGSSQYFLKPFWQAGVAGKYRQVPDVSALADPYTGVPIVLTEDGTTYFEPGWGGTSVASPIFTSIWAIADQYNGFPLGFATPTISQLKSSQITDVVPTNALSSYNVTATITDPNGTTNYNSDQIYSDILYTTTQFTSAIWPYTETDTGLSYVEYDSISFGTDSSLTVTKGWDNVTGYGEPNGLPFIQGVSKLARGLSFGRGGAKASPIVDKGEGLRIGSSDN